jgi:hypothetical protein
MFALSNGSVKPGRKFHIRAIFPFSFCARSG